MDQVIPWVGLALLLLISPLISARFVLRDRGGFRPLRFLLLTIFLLVPPLVIVFYESMEDWLYEWDLETWLVIWGMISLVIGMIWLEGKGEDVRWRGMMAKLLFRCFVVTAVILGLMAKGFYWEEKYWVARNVLWEPSADYPTKAWELVDRGEMLEHEVFLKELHAVRTEGE